MISSSSFEASSLKRKQEEQERDDFEQRLVESRKAKAGTKFSRSQTVNVETLRNTMSESHITSMEMLPKAKSLSGSEAAELELKRKGEERVAEAADWVDKELNKLVNVIKEKGEMVNKKYQITFGLLFDVTQDSMEALSGTLITAKKNKIVDYEGHLLMQRKDDDVMVYLLTSTIDKEKIEKYSKSRDMSPSLSPREVASRAMSTASSTQMFQPNKCFSCGKTAYPQEQIIANEKPFHKSCFRCSVPTCHKPLTLAEFAVQGDTFYCVPHHHQQFLKKADYVHVMKKEK